MAKIHVLDKAVAELIAAGEVVERPSSVVKELLENSIDAGADTVTVEITGGGVRSIRISDNGVGIERDDIPKAFVRHATSKVRDAGDLDEIVTLGFRGEALASIAAVAKVELTTKWVDDQEGTCYRMEGGTFAGRAPAGCPTGTTISVRELFYNTPARMKFLKKDVSEGNAVAQVVEKCALSHPEVSFQFIRDGAVKLRTSGSGDQLAVIAAIYGRDTAKDMLPVDYTDENGMKVYGYISSPNGVRPSRTYQNFFINGRYVRTHTASAALEEAYKNKIMSGRFPACVLNLGIDPQSVDVNVHPAKIEVRFAREKSVFSAVYFAVKGALQRLEQPVSQIEAKRPSTPVVNAFTLRTEMAEPKQQRLRTEEYRSMFGGGEKPAFNKKVSLSAPSGPEASPLGFAKVSPPQQPGHQAVHSATATHSAPTPASSSLWEDARQQVESIPHWPTAEPEPTTGPQPAAESGLIPPNRSADTPMALRLVGEAFGTYILLEREDNQLLLVDKHAAHERLLYEQLRDNLAHEHRQVLLTPQTVALAQEDCAALLENLDKLDQMGFSVEDFGGGTVVVREVPLELGENDIPYILCEIADKLRQGSYDLTPHALDRLYYSIACRSAIKAGDKNSDAELARLVEKLEANPQITHCPHGRPVSVMLSRHQVEKMFGRLG